MPDLGTIAAVILAVVLVERGTAIRQGRSREFQRYYRNENLPAIVRNAGFALIPAGLAFASGLLGGVVLALDGPRTLAELLLIGFPTLAAAAFVIALRPPRWAKPWWLQVEETADASRRPRLTGFDVIVGGCLIVASSVGAIAATYLASRGS